MQQYELELPGGSKVTSGVPEAAAISQVRLTRCVNSQTELMPGAVCAGMVEVTVLQAQKMPAVQAGDELKLFAGEDLVGIFIAQKPESTGASSCRITAYDRVSLLEQDLGQWLCQLPGWPYTLSQLARMICDQCGLSLVGELAVNADHPVERFSISQVTARQLMQWVCQLGGCFCFANAEGALELGWYRQTDICLRPTGETFYYRDGLSGAAYWTEPVQKVHLQKNDGDAGAVYPDASQTGDTLCLSGNPMLGSSAQQQKEAARQLFEQFAPIRYMPCTVRTADSCGIRAGDIFQVETPEGTVGLVYAMQCVSCDGLLTVQCTGSASRDSSTAVNIARYESAEGRVTQLKMDVEGLTVQCADNREALAQLSLDADGIRAQVSRVEADTANTRSWCTRMEQDAQSLYLQVQEITETGAGRVVTSTGYTLDEEGLKISKAGEEMENLLDNTGMYVRRSGEVILRANAAGVEATDVTVHNYLIIGNHCRLEDYASGTDNKRTACFFLE